jgi:hypothetical protein
MHSHNNWELIIVSAIKLLKTFGLIPGSVGAFWLRRFFQKRIQQKAMEGWPAADAQVFGSGEVRREGRRYWAEITYTYYVGEYRAGRYVRAFKSEFLACEFLVQLRDKTIRVHYRMDDPDKSVILDRDLEMIVLLAPQYG